MNYKSWQKTRPLAYSSLIHDGGPKLCVPIRNNSQSNKYYTPEKRVAIQYSTLCLINIIIIVGKGNRWSYK